MEGLSELQCRGCRNRKCRWMGEFSDFCSVQNSIRNRAAGAASCTQTERLCSKWMLALFYTSISDRERLLGQGLGVVGNTSHPGCFSGPHCSLLIVASVLLLWRSPLCRHTVQTAAKPCCCCGGMGWDGMLCGQEVQKEPLSPATPGLSWAAFCAAGPVDRTRRFWGPSGSLGFHILAVF